MFRKFTPIFVVAAMLASVLAPGLTSTAQASDGPTDWAILICGGWNTANNNARYWNDLSEMYEILTGTYGYTAANIFVLYADGNPPTAANCGDHEHAHNHYPTDIIDYAATRANLDTVTDTIAASGHRDDTLFVFSTDHGDDNGDLCLWGETTISPATFAGPNYMGDITQYSWRAFEMEQCYSGCFIAPLSGPRTMIATACRCDEPSCGAGASLFYYDPFCYYFNAALKSALPVPAGGGAVDADANGDGKVSFVEAFNYAEANDYCVEQPQYDDNGDGTSHTEQMPAGGDGCLGSMTFLGQTHTAIERGLGWLCANQDSGGSWYGDPAVTSFAVLTMLNWGFDETDEIVSKGINYVLSKINPDGSVYNQPNRYTYYTSIAILPLAATYNADYHDEIQSMRNWLIGSQWDESSFYGGVDTSHWYYGGFGYGNGERPDNSNTQWALMGIKAADRVLGLEATDTYAKAADYFLERCRNADGGSAYTPGDVSVHTMTAASVWSYALCGRGSGDEALAGIQWLTDRYSLTNNDGWGYWSEYYYKVTLAKDLTMTHKVKLGEHDWFEELSDKLADEQYADGNWPDTGMMGTEMSTCWAIMALQTRTLPPSGVFGMWATLESHCDLHMYDSLGRHTGVNYVTGTVEENIPGSDFKILDPDGNEVPYSGSTPDDGYRQVIELSGLVAGSYRIELVATSDGPYHLTVVGLSDGDQVTTHTFEGTVEEGDRLATSVTATSMEGALTLLYEPLIALPVLGVDPAHLEVVGPPGTIAQGAFTVSEVGGEQTLHDVTIYCTDIVGVEGLVDGDDVTFDINDFDLGPGGSQEVNASIPVPFDFKGPGVGSIIVESIDGGTKEITLTLWPWSYIFEDPRRGTRLFINTDDKTLQFTDPDGYDSGIVSPDNMRVLYGGRIMIWHEDNSLSFTCRAETNIGSCYAALLDLMASTRYLLDDPPG